MRPEYCTVVELSNVDLIGIPTNIYMCELVIGLLN